MKRFLIFYIIFIGLFFVVVNHFAQDKKEQYNTEWDSKNFNYSISKNPHFNAKINNNWHLHYAKLNEHYALPNVKKTSIRVWIRDDESVQGFYKDYLKRGHTQQIFDLAHWGMARYYNEKGMPGKALEMLGYVSDSTNSYVQEEYAVSYMMMYAHDKAKPLLVQSLSDTLSPIRTLPMYLQILFIEGDYTTIDSLYANSAYKKYFKGSQVRELYLAQNDFLAYLLYVFKAEVTTITLFTAFFVFVVWFFFLIQLKVFSSVNWLLVFLVFFLSCIITFSTTFLYEFYHYVFHFGLNGDSFHDLLYCIFGIGVIEEFVKLVPFFIILLIVTILKKKPDYIDYIIFGGVSALGFAVIEDLIVYFDPYRPDIFKSRAFITSFIHVSCTTWFVYFFIVAKRSIGGKRVVSLLVGFFGAAFLHGMYDYWIINPPFHQLSFLYYIMLLMLVPVYAFFVNNAVNFSASFDYKKIHRVGNISRYLLVSMTCVVLLEYLLNIKINGLSTSNEKLLVGFVPDLFLIVFFTVQLSKLDLVKNYWQPFKLIHIYNKLVNNKLIGSYVELVADKSHSRKSIFPMFGLIVERLYIGAYTTYFVVEFESDKNLPYNQVIVKQKYDDLKINRSTYIGVYILSFNEEKKYQLDPEDLKLIDHAFIKIV